MLHNLAGFIFGKSSPNTTNPAGQEQIDYENAPLSEEIIDGDDNGEWLMVDVRKDENTPPNQSVPVELDLALPSSDASSGENSPTVDERGWNLTPPPCFTASYQREKQRLSSITMRLDQHDTNTPMAKMITGIVDVDPLDDPLDQEKALKTVLETSNFENLLIEHPSMSVYHRIQKRESPQRVSKNINTVTQGKSVNTGEQEKKIMQTDANTSKNAVAVGRPQRPKNTMEILLGDELISAIARRADLVEQQRVERALKSKELGITHWRRTNAVTWNPSLNSAGTPRKRRVKNHPSGRCNDRKCQ